MKVYFKIPVLLVVFKNNLFEERYLVFKLQLHCVFNNEVNVDFMIQRYISKLTIFRVYLCLRVLLNQSVMLS